MSNKPGTLFVVATPIGNLADLSPRAAEVLGAVDLIAAEDTRRTRPLLAHFGIGTPMIAVHEHNERAVLEGLLDRLERGESIALVSDAGTPLISDPGFPLVRAAHRRGIRVSPIPGPSALLGALSAAGLPTDRFVFEGFLPRSAVQRRSRLRELAGEPRTLVFFESGHRVAQAVEDMAAVLGADRPALLARELTKMFETLVAASLSELAELVRRDEDQRRGELVLVVGGAAPGPSEGVDAQAQRILRVLAGELPLKQAAALAARITGEKKNRLYRLALEWEGGGRQPST
ncbi:MAG: 16S rRNA (cytidine(1402)-2'-O)-methyltransferase [Chromatiales bacterium]